MNDDNLGLIEFMEMGWRGDGVVLLQKKVGEEFLVGMVVVERSQRRLG